MIMAGADVLGPLLGPVAGSLRVALMGVGGLAIGIYVTVWALQKAWGLFKGLASDPMVRGMTWNYDGSHPGGSVGERGVSTVGDGIDWSDQQAEYDAEMNATGPDHEQYEADGSAKDAAAISYLDRYR
jgi:hypothetical protein